MNNLLKDVDLSYDDVTINPNFSNITSRFDNNQVFPYVDGKLPIVNAPMDSIASMDFIPIAKDKIFTVFSHRFQTKEEQIAQIKLGANGAVIGMADTLETAQSYVEAGANHILLDVANGGNIAVVRKLEQLQELRLNVKLWAGNVANAVTYNSIARLCDYVRCGIGGGNACLTARNTGCGRTALSTVLECRTCYSEDKAKIVADGGINTNGDICKALVAGAHLVMVGKCFAATEESNAEMYSRGDTRYKRYKGMASKEAIDILGKERYSVEGDSGMIKMSGSLVDYLEQLDSNLRSCMGYIDASNLEEIYKFGELRRISYNAANEGRSQLLKL